MRELIYLWDHNGYMAPTPVLFETNCQWTTEDLEKLSWKVVGAGRLSVDFYKFKKLLEKEGFEVIHIKTGDSGEKLKDGIEEIRGATGNY